MGEPFWTSGSFWASVVAGLFALAAALYAQRSARRNRVEAETNTNRSPTPPTTQQVWDRLDRLEVKFAAMGRVLAQAAEQWPADHEGPTFDPDDIEILEDTMPLPWRRRPPRRGRTA
jgi:hypothetical protein